MAAFDGKAVLIVGGGGAMGRATAVKLAEAGASIIVADINLEQAIITAEQVRKFGGEAIVSRMDMSKEGDVEASVALAVSQYGRLDGAANIAGATPTGKALHEMTLEEFNACASLILNGAFFCIKHQARAMLSTGGGSIVMISSVAAIKSFPRHAEYSGAKAGVLGMVRGAAHDYGELGIRVNAILPGPIDTPSIRKALAKNPEIETYISRQPLVRRLGQADEVANGIRWLLSDEAAFVTGMSIPIDGGQSVG